MELLIPLNSRERVAGIIMLGQKANEEDYTEEEKGFLLTLSSIAAVAVENARLYELATVDLKTRLKIHHYFQTRLREEIERAKRLKIPLSLLITDIDHFKKFNDKYGHQTGDFVLKNVASVLLANIRTYDIAARFGGEEFTVILPNTPIKKAQTIGNRIRREIEKSVFISEQGELKVTISVGVAQLDPDNENGNNDLIEKADKALYQAKDAGRNRTIVYENDNGSKI